MAQGPNAVPLPSLFPAGKAQARVQLPALFIIISVAQATEGLSDISAVLAGGATAIVLVDDTSSGAARFYEAAIAIKDAIRGRAAFLIADRMDISDAVDADGVLLSPTGLPTVIARGMLQTKSSLVGRIVDSGESAVQAAAEDANFIIMTAPEGSNAPCPDPVVLQQAGKQRSGNRGVAVIPKVGGSVDETTFSSLIDAGADGVAVRLADVSPLAATVTHQPHRTLEEATSMLLAAFAQGVTVSEMGTEASDGRMEEEESSPPVAQLSQVLNADREDIVAGEKDVLGRLETFLNAMCPALEEVSLLRDALKQLDELFLLVVVGEFNSGKSAVINALLGRRVLSEGILPTTNEITVLKWADPADLTSDCTEQTTDGLFVRHIPADLLREINIVDTPGTNVILDRQQRLTEEFVPRADLVLFVMSADRPFTDSEVRFLRYIRQWGKKVLFVVNKADLLADEDEVIEVSGFVADNASRLLGVDGARVFPVSAKLATEAKLACRAAKGDGGTGVLTRDEERLLSGHPAWVSSRFEGLESFMRDFLTGGAGESARLKLQTPLFVGEALVSAGMASLIAEAEVARADAASVALVRSQLKAFKTDMLKEGRLQRDEIAKHVGALTGRAGAVVDNTLTLSNWNALTSYIFGPGERGGRLPVGAAFREEVPKDAAVSVATTVREHSTWVHSNCTRQIDNYRGFAAARAAALGRSFEELLDSNAAALAQDAEARTRWRRTHELAASEGGAVPSELSEATRGGFDAGENLVAVTAGLDPVATEVLLEGEVREAVLSTASTAASAAGLGVILTSILPTTLEDLMVLAVSAAIGYASVLNLPLRRAEAKKKLEAAAAAAASEVQRKMEVELNTALDACEAQIIEFIGPLEAMTAAELARADAAVESMRSLGEEIALLQRRVADIE